MLKEALKSLILIYQYTYYAIRKSDKSAELSIGFTKIKVITLFSVFQTFLLMTIFGWIDTMRGYPFHKLSTSVFVVFPYLLVLSYINLRLLGPKERMQGYKAIFDCWDDRKRQRWTYYVASIVLLIFVSFFIVLEVRHGMRQSK